MIERTLNPKASRILRALNAEAELFPELHRRYLDEIVTPRRAALRDLGFRLGSPSPRIPRYSQESQDSAMAAR